MEPGTNTTGFSALLAGHRTPGGSFEELTTRTHYWTSTLDGGNPTQVHHIYLWDLNSNISFHNGAYAGYGFSLRCIKD